MTEIQVKAKKTSREVQAEGSERAKIMIKIVAPNKPQKVCDNCGSHENVQFIKIGSPDAMCSFALCKRCREHLCKLMKGGEADGR